MAFPAADVWYWFKVQVDNTGALKTIKANVRGEGSAEQTEWKEDCYDNSSTRLTAGTIGVWSYFTSSKYWDDLAVELKAH